MNLYAQLKSIDEYFGKNRRKKIRRNVEKIRTIRRNNERRAKELLAEIIRAAEKAG